MFLLHTFLHQRTPLSLFRPPFSLPARTDVDSLQDSSPLVSTPTLLFSLYVTTPCTSLSRTRLRRDARDTLTRASSPSHRGWAHGSRSCRVLASPCFCLCFRANTVTRGLVKKKAWLLGTYEKAEGTRESSLEATHGTRPAGRRDATPGRSQQYSCT